MKPTIILYIFIISIAIASATKLGKGCNQINQVEECERFACYVNKVTDANSSASTATTCQVCRTTEDCQQE